MAFLRHHRLAIAMASTAVAGTWLVVVAVVVVAMGAGPAPAELAVDLAIPAPAMNAYQQAAASPGAAGCGVRWQILAGIGRVESNHAIGHTIDTDGTVTPPVLGVVLDGTAGTALVADTDRGILDGDTIYDRAVGPLQFLPSTWRAFGGDGNDDGKADPNNIHDAATAAIAHLCATAGGRLDRDEALTRALRAYNNSDAYVPNVLAWINYYDDAASLQAASLAQPTGTIVEVRGTRVDGSISANLKGLLAAADDDGLILAGSGYRSSDQQIALRRAHCGTSDYAIYNMASDECSPPTARPGESLHESGLAIDFTCGGVLVTSTDRCFAFLATNAHTYGLFNLPAEPWHWSTNGK